MIDRDICILSHPRSGSHWFQSCLVHHYSMGEFFNVRNIESFNFGEAGARPSSYVQRNLSLSEFDVLLDQRILQFKARPGLKSVKLHFFQLNEKLSEWLLGRDFHFFKLERRDRIETLKSLLIANHLKKFFGPLQHSEIVVTHENFLECHAALSWSEEALLPFSANLNSVYYEDLLEMKSQDWFEPSRTKMTRQKSAEKVKIINWSQVENWIHEARFV